MPDTRPNLLLFMPETLRADAVFGKSKANTPNMDRLGQEGVHFTNCFVQHTVCTPSRCSMFSGWYPHTNGHRTLTYLLQEHEHNLFRDLKEAGYKTVCYGKNDLLAQAAIPLSFDSVTAPIKPPPKTKKFEFWKEGDKHYDTFYYGKRDEEFGKDGDWAQIQSALEFLDQEHDKPFCLFLPLSFSHPTYFVEDPYYSSHDPSEMPAPIPVPEGKGKRRYVNMMRTAYGLDKLDESEFREIKRTYYGMINRLDHQLGQLTDKLKEKGLWDNTALFVFSDHGDYAGDYGLTEKWWTAFEDCLSNTPLIMRVPGRPSTGKRQCLVEMIDFYATILDVAGIEPKHYHFGQSLLAQTDPATPDRHRDAVFCEGGHLQDELHCREPLIQGKYYQKTHLPEKDPRIMSKAVMIRTEDYKYIHCPDEFDELYDLKKDPIELNNAVEHPEYRDIANEMKTRLLTWFVETGDTAPLEWDPRGWVQGKARPVRPDRRDL